ncbi:MAG: hypothetical protein AAGI01_07880 [Myxococcota bacterium]
MRQCSGVALVAWWCVASFSAQASAQPEVKVSLSEGVALKGPGDEQLRIGYLGWFRYQINARRGEPASHGFALPVSRPMLTAAFAEQQLVLFTQAEMGGDLDARLLDAEVVWRSDRLFGVHAGYYRPYFSRSFRTALPLLVSPGRGEVVDTFRPPRDFGVTAMGVLADGSFEYQAGVFNGPQDPRIARYPRRVTARVAYNPMGRVPYTQTPWLAGVADTRVAVGAQAMWASPVRLDVDGALVSSDDFSAAVDVTVFTPRLASLTEAHVRLLDQPTPDAQRDLEIGATTRLAYLVVPERFDVSGQLSVIQLAADDQPALALGAGGQWYLVGNHAKLQAFYQLKTPSDPEGVVAHLVQAQAQLWF